MSRTLSSSVAIIGIGCRFPGAPDLRAYERLLLEGRYAIEELPRSRFDAERYFDPDPAAYGKSYSKLAGCIDESTRDLGCLLPPSALAAADTIQRCTLEVACATVEHAGLDPSALRARRSGLLLGHSRCSQIESDLSLAVSVESLLSELDHAESWKDVPAATRERVRRTAIEDVRRKYPAVPRGVRTAYTASASAELIALAFGLRGRHAIVDAACASSLAAIGCAVNALQQGALDYALAGGATLTTAQLQILFAQARALSAEGSFPFDARANGFIASDGIGLLLLARLEDAVAAGHTVHGIVHAVGASCDGRGKALWAPNTKGQVLALRNAYARCDVAPGHLGYVEAHGTSTALGDATEVESLTRFFGPHFRDGRRLPVGSVKSNIGHTRAAAGVAGVVKALVAFGTGTIPPSIQFETPSPKIDWASTPLSLVREPLAWPRGDQPRFAGVDSFGIGGVNYHTVLEDAPAPERLAELLSQRRGTSAGNRSPAHRSDEERDPIAIVGIACIVPGSRGVESFWKRLRAGHVAIRPVPAQRWPASIYYQEGEAAPFRANSGTAGAVDAFEADWKRLRIPPALVKNVDPMQLMLLESALDALQDAGIDLESSDRERIGVFVGTPLGSDFGHDIGLAIRLPELVEFFEQAATEAGIDEARVRSAGAELLARLRARLPEINGDSPGSVFSSPSASRISGTLDLHGPAGVFDSGYASSLVALQSACEALRAGTADTILWAGAERGLACDRFVDAARRRFTGGDRTTPFDAEEGGTVLGEGVAVCVLRRESVARAAGNRIYALIHGIESAGGPDGDRAIDALRSAIERAHHDSGIAPSALGYAEALPSGPSSSDEALIATMNEALTAPERTTPLLVGSASANVGFAQGAAGAISIVKTALALHHREIPPTPAAGATRPLDMMELCREARPLTTCDPVYASVTSFSPGGVSAHVILGTGDAERHEDGVTTRDSAMTHGVREPAVFRGRNREDVRRQLDAAARRGEDLQPGSVTGTGPVAVAVSAGPRAAERLQLAMNALASSTPSVALPASGVALTDFSLPDETCFMFPGQGSQYAGMLRDVSNAYPSAAVQLQKVDEALVRCGEVPLSEVMWERTELLAEVLWTQISVLGGDLMMLEVARTHRLVPTIVTGHSYGDYAALIAAGAWSIDEAVETTVARCRAIVASDKPGGMAAVFAGRATVGELLRGLPGYAVESNVNAPDEVIVSGDPTGIDALLARCESQNVNARRLPVPRPFHSELMRPAASMMAPAIERIAFAQPAIRFLTSSGATFVAEPAELRNALIDQFTRPVDFIAQIEAAYAAGCRRFVEVGPGNLLSKLATRILRGRPAAVVPLNDRKIPGLTAIGSALAVLRAHDFPSMPPAASAAAAQPCTPGEIRFFDVTTRRARSGDPAPPQRVPDPRQPAAVTPEPASGASSRRGIEKRLVELVAAQSGYPPELIGLDADLEADLGIDTIKQAQILGGIRSMFDLPTDETMAIRDLPTLHLLADYVERSIAPGATPQGGTSADPEPGAAIEAALIDLVCEQSGYPRELVGLDADLEADLGIDTIKQAQILGAIRTMYDLPTDETMAIRDTPTLRALSAYVATALRGGGAAAPVAVPDDVGVRLDAEPPRPSVAQQEGSRHALDLDALASAPEARQRYVLRSSPIERPDPAGDGYRPERLVVVGGGEVALAVRDALASRGIPVEVIALDSPDLARAVSRAPVPDLCIVSGAEALGQKTHPPGDAVTSAELERTRMSALWRGLQHWVRAVESGNGLQRATLSAMTTLGGAFGSRNASAARPEGGAIVGICRALRREFPRLRVKLVDFETGTRPASAAEALSAELGLENEPGEIGYLRGNRHVVRLVPAPARLDPLRLEELRAFPYVLLTGGARGITAEIALRLAEAGVRRLHLLGSTPLPADVAQWRSLDAQGLDALRQDVLRRLRAERKSVSPVEWQTACEPIERAIEIDRNLRRIEDAGASAVYHAADVVDAAALDGVLERIRAVDGPVSAVVHGAGFQRSRGFLSKSESDLEATLAPKVAGCQNLIRATGGDPVRLFVAFGSVAGRFGGMGQADYSLASELLARLVGALAVARPDCRAFTIAWPAWDEVGMAVHKQTLHMLQKRGVNFMPVREGCDHFMREVFASGAETEVTVGSEVSRLAPSWALESGSAEERERVTRTAAALPLIDTVLAASGDQVESECLLDADRDPYLTQHRHGNKAITPAVVLLELMAESAALLTGEAPSVLENVVIHNGVKLSHARRLALRGRAVQDGARVALELRADQLGWNSHVLALDQLRVSGLARYDGGTSPSSGVPLIERPPHAEQARYQDASGHLAAPSGWHHGPALQSLIEFAVGDGDLHWGSVRILPPRALRPSHRGGWILSAPALDGCLAFCVRLSRATLKIDGLPSSFGRIRIGRTPEEGEICTVVARHGGHDGRLVHFDFTLFGADGSPRIVVESFALRTFDTVPAARPGARRGSIEEQP